MNRRCLPWLVCTALVAISLPALAQDSRPGIIGQDDRLPIISQGPPWDAVGQVNVGGYRLAVRCTGTLVAPDVVLTAAHCVMDSWRKVPLPLHDIHFLAGVRGAESKGHATAKCLHFAKTYEFQAPEKMLPVMAAQKSPLRALATDMVAIVLNEKLIVDPAPLAEGIFAEPGLRLVHAAYPADRRFVLTAHFDCHLLQASAGSLWLTDCDTHPASSGGPLFTTVDGALKLAAIMVAGTTTTNIAAPISKSNDLTRNDSCP